MPQGHRPRPARPAPAKPVPVGATAAPVAAPSAAAPRPARAPRAPFVLLVVGLLCGGLVSLLLLNTVLARDSFELSKLRADINLSHQQKEELEHTNMLLEMPAAVSNKAGLQGLNPDWDQLRTLTPGHPGSRTASDGQTLAGQEPVPGTGR
ncbi:hypothetical protein [Streptosporangium subroseum]|uniref:hypothetical protein n=1 Tax=Streptosporangium subroseum TaxID=106412 RepID=UPI00308ADB1E|nr:hypothetical protein OHB15_32760 [Streptosporangium subroseum]